MTKPCLAVLLALVCACSSSASTKKSSPDAAGDTVSSAHYSATIRWTSYGIPHIQAKDLGSVFFGQGYAFAKDNICVLADQVVKVRSERAKYFGPGQGNINVDNDFANKALLLVAHATQNYALLSADARAAVDGYVAGYNKRLADVGPAGLPAECKNAAWVQPISAIDLLAYGQDLAKIASGRNFRAYVNSTIVPSDGAANSPAGLPWLKAFEDLLRAPQAMTAMSEHFKEIRDPAIGSNGWGIGSERSASGGGLVVANPHFPWLGELRLWESQLTVPGVLDVAGVALYGVPGVLIGHNANVAFTATVSASRKFTIYKLTLDPKDPTTYLVDGQPHKMAMHEETVDILGADGKLTQETRKFYRTEYGPILVLPAIAEWTKDNAYALRDGNENNQKLYEHFLTLDKAKNIDDVEAVLRDISGNPWTNMMAADASGEVYYCESNSTPNLGAAAVADHQAALASGDFLTQFAWGQGLVLLDGAKSTNDWLVEPGSRDPGLVPYAKTPHLRRKDYIYNANDSHWLTNLAQPLEGYGYLFGEEKTERSARTRMNLKLLTEVQKDGASGEDGKFTLEELKTMVFADRVWTAEDLAAALAARCQGKGKVSFLLGSKGQVCADAKASGCADAQPTAVDLAAACTVLTAWDKRFTAQSKGAALFREFFARAPNPLYEHAFDVTHPATTPNTLKAAPAAGDDPMLMALAAAANALISGKFTVDAAMGDVQYTLKNDVRIPIHGGLDEEGAFQVIGFVDGENDTLLPRMKTAALLGPTTLTAQGYPVNYGSSFVMTCELTAAGPKAFAVLTYSESSDPGAPHNADQTQLFSKSTWRPMLFTDAEIAADPELKSETVSN